MILNRTEFIEKALAFSMDADVLSGRLLGQIKKTPLVYSETDWIRPNGFFCMIKKLWVSSKNEGYGFFATIAMSDMEWRNKDRKKIYEAKKTRTLDSLWDGINKHIKDINVEVWSVDEPGRPAIYI